MGYGHLDFPDNTNHTLARAVQYYRILEIVRKVGW